MDAGPGADAAGVDAGDRLDAGLDAAPDGGPSETLDVGIISGDADSLWESESHLAMAPDGRVLAVWMSLRRTGLVNGFAFSPDRGVTWEPPDTTEGFGLGDPVAAATPDGRFFYGWLDGVCGGQGCAQGHLWIARWQPETGAFSAPVDASPADPAAFYDKPWLMATADGSLLAVFAARVGEYPDNVDSVLAARSADGEVWTRSFVVEARLPGQIAGIPHACASAQAARVWALYVDLDSPVSASVRWSDDHGASWPAGNVSTGFADPADVFGLQAYDLRCVGEGDDVWVMHGLASMGSGAAAIPPLDEIRVAHSGDGGSSWDPPVAVAVEGALFLRPEIARDSSGVLHLIAYSGTEDGDPQGVVRRWASGDGGASWQEQEPVHSPILFDGSRVDDFWIGDYSGLLAEGGDLFVTYADNASGAAHVAFYRTSARLR